jgi:beta-glucanase (GH16 family)
MAEDHRSNAISCIGDSDHVPWLVKLLHKLGENRGILSCLTSPISRRYFDPVDAMETVDMSLSSRRRMSILACLLITAAAAIFARQDSIRKASEPPQSDLQLVWSDEFDKDGPPDSRNWTYERGFVRNREFQWYQPDNARCKNGFLVIEGRRERVKNPDYVPGSKNWKTSREYADYTSTCLITKGLHQWTYGRFEMRGRIDTRPGMWPAFWTLGVARPWPGSGEIDIMEYYQGMLLANACWASEKPWTAVWDDFKKPVDQFGDPQWSSKFHVWRMDWDENQIKLYVDNELLNTVNLQETINRDSEKSNPFREPHYILLNLAIGGQAGGDPSNTQFPARFEIDYVRVYQTRPR